MRTISSWEDLREFGIVPLTGESCGLDYRILCDVTEQGRKTIAKMLGLGELPLPENWNSGHDGNPHVGSILLVPEMFTAIAVFALLESGCTDVWLYRNRSVLGIEPADAEEQIELCRKMASEALLRTFSYRGTAGDRNVHVMSGRVI